MSDIPLPGNKSDACPDASVIIVDNISKQFALKTHQASDLRERFQSVLRRQDREERGAFWALDNISFSVSPGQTLGIVGHNGSGKSTLLKILTGILKPTHGQVTIRGRVGALIEVGAGFHPDLSGRENIYLNGSILGLTRRQIDDKFDSIVSFAGLEKFIDTPVKRYSSGMYMRLGFSIAAHTEPDILLIDEVLAVGDTIFQRKCIRHLKEFVKRGGAVVFVSHAMVQVEEVCDTCLWLDFGKQRFYGPTKEAIEQYMNVVAEREEAEFKRLYPKEWEIRQAERQRLEEEAREAERLRQEAEEEAQRQREQDKNELSVAERQAIEQKQAWLNDPLRGRLTGIIFRNQKGQAVTQFEAGESLAVEVGYRMPIPLPCPSFSIEFFRKEDDLHMFSTSNFDHQLRWQQMPEAGYVRFNILLMSLNAGTYRVRLRLYREWQSDRWDDVVEDEIWEAATVTVSAGRFGHGCTFLPVQWNESPVPDIGARETDISPAIAEAA